MAFLTRSAIIEKAHGFKTEVVAVPEWGGDVLVRELSVTEVTHIGMEVLASRRSVRMDELDSLDDLTAVRIDIRSLGKLFPQIVAWCVVDEAMGSVLSVNDVEQMTGESSEAVQRIATVALRLSGLAAGRPAEGEEPEGEDGAETQIEVVDPN